MKKKCPVCTSEAIYDIGQKGEFILSACLDCGLAFLKNDFVYSDYYDSFYFDNYGNPEALTDKTKIKPGDFGYSRDRDKHGRMYQMAFDALGKFTDVEGKKYLDVGCAEGVGMEIAACLGADPYGLDVSTDAVGRCKSRGLQNTYAGQLEDFDQCDFDLVTMLDVVEHFQDPVSALRALNRSVAASGLVYIRNNLFDTQLFRTDKDYFNRQFEPPYHCSYFSEKGLRELMKREGFDLMYRKPRAVTQVLEAYAFMKRLVRPDFRRMHEKNRISRLDPEQSLRMAKGSGIGDKISRIFPSGFIFKKAKRI